MKKKVFNYFVKFSVIACIFISIISIFTNKDNNKVDIYSVVNSKYYSYLPAEVKEKIVDYYEENNIILKTEKNKRNDDLYVNPDYISYVLSDEKDIYGNVPDFVTSDVNVDLEPILGVSDGIKKFDLRNYNGKNNVTSIKNQFTIPVCWDFANTSAVESYLVMNDLEENTIDLSETQMDYVTANPDLAIKGNYNPYYITETADTLAFSGTVKRYLKGAIYGVGLVDESKFGYEIGTSVPLSHKDVWNDKNSLYEVNSYQEINSKNLNQDDLISFIKDKIKTTGAVTSTVTMAYYKTKLKYNVEEEERLNKNYSYNYILYRDSSYTGSSDHLVHIIGWNDEVKLNVCVGSTMDMVEATYNDGKYSCSKGTLKELNGAWIAKNSYGESSDSAYFYIAYQSSETNYGFYNDISKRDYDNSYNPLNFTKKFYSTYNISYIYKKFNKSEKLKKIKFYSKTANSKAEIYVSTTSKESDVILVKEVQIPYEGVYTVDLEDENIILNNDTFIINAKLYNNDDIPSTEYYKYGFDSDFGISAFTTNLTDDVSIKIEDAKIENTILNQKLATIDNYDNIIYIYGKSRNIETGKNLDFVIKDSNNIDVTSKFSISDNVIISNYLFSKIEFNNEDVLLGTYKLEAKLNSEVISTSTIIIDERIEKIIGEGTLEDPYLISNPIQLGMINTDLFGNYKLTCDIDLTYDTSNENGIFYNNGKGWQPLSINFNGTLDGDGHKIIGLHINRPNEDNVGFFKSSTNSNYIHQFFKNITFVDPVIVGRNKVGTLIGDANSYTYSSYYLIENISVIGGSVTGSEQVGGIIGDLRLLDNLSPRKQYVSNLFNSASVSSKNYSGGIAGYLETTNFEVNNSALNVSNLVNMGAINSDDFSGGIFGGAKHRSKTAIHIENVINYGNVQGENAYEIVPFVDNYSGGNGNIGFKNVYYMKGKPYNENKLNLLDETSNVSLKTFDQMKDISSFEAWNNFSDNFEIKRVDNVTRFANLKIAQIIYHNSLNDININKNDTFNIYNSITPDISIAKNAIFEIEDSEIISINSNSIVTGLKVGTTNINYKSLYDGYEKTIKVVVNDYDNYVIKYIDGEYSNSQKVYLNASNVVLNPNGIESENTSYTKVKDNYTFAGWIDEKTNITYQDNYVITKHLGEKDDIITLKAKWIPKTYTVKYDSNTGYGFMDNQIATYDNNEVIKTNIFTKDNYSFVKWNTKKDGTGTSYNQGDIFKNLTSSDSEVILYAIWEPGKYKIIYKSNNEKQEEIEEYAFWDNNHTLLLNSFEFDKHTFKYWNTKEDGTGTSYNNQAIVSNLINPTLTITLYAVWEDDIGFSLTSYTNENGLIENIDEKTKLSDYVNKISYLNENYFIKVYDLDDNLIDNDDYIATGYKTKFYYKNEVLSTSYNVIKGDVNSDGKVDIFDAASLFIKVKTKESFSNESIKKAADLNKNNKITIADVSKLLSIVKNN